MVSEKYICMKNMKNLFMENFSNVVMSLGIIEFVIKEKSQVYRFCLISSTYLRSRFDEFVKF